MISDSYDILVMQLSEEDGSGFLAIVPDLVGCMSDGETQEEAVANVRDAIVAWCEAEEAAGRECPKPGSARSAAIEQDKEVLSTLQQQSELIETMHQRIKELESSGRDRITVGGAWYSNPSRKEISPPIPKTRNRVSH